MDKVFSLSQLAEVTKTSLGPDINVVTKRWEDTGLLEGLKDDAKARMARLFENQAIELLRGQTSGLLTEANVIGTGGASLTSAGNITGFTSVAFPIVRRVFAGLVANEIVSIQPMHLPSGLLFYLDYTYGSNVGGDSGLMLSSASTKETYKRGDSLYNAPPGKGVQSGSLATGGMYDLVGQGYTKVHREALTLSGSGLSVGYWISGSTWSASGTPTVKTSADFVGYNARFVNYDPRIENDVANNVLDYCFVHVSASEFTSKISGADLLAIEQIAIVGVGGTPGGTTAWGQNYQGGLSVYNLRSVNKRGDWNEATGIFTPNALNGNHVQFALCLSNTGSPPTLGNATSQAITASTVIADAFSANSDGSTLVVPSFETDFAYDSSPRIPDIDIKIESINVTATSRKLRARWSPEMAQDITAYFAIDIEAELTNILSEAITLEIDREILNDLLSQASAANFFWSRSPGKFVNKQTGAEGTRTSTLAPGPAFTGTIQDWYQTLVETISDAANQIGKKTLRGSGNFLVVSPEIATILEHTISYRPSYKLDGDGQVKDGMTIGAELAGSLSGRYTVYKDPYFPATKILVGKKGSTFLESGYVYAPYVPLILTPVIYGTEDFTPRKGIMTRYGKKMIRSDFYATVTVMDLSII